MRRITQSLYIIILMIIVLMAGLIWFQCSRPPSAIVPVFDLPSEQEKESPKITSKIIFKKVGKGDFQALIDLDMSKCTDIICTVDKKQFSVKHGEKTYHRELPQEFSIYESHFIHFNVSHSRLIVGMLPK